MTKSLGALCASLMIVCGLDSSARSCYVNAFSTGTREDGSIRAPFRSLVQAGRHTYAPGDTIFLAGNQVHEGTLVLNGADGVTVTSYGNGKARIYAADSSAVIIDSCRNVCVRDIIVEGSGRLSGNKGSGIDIRQSSSVKVSNVEASGFLLNGIGTFGGGDIDITDCYVHRNGYNGIEINSEWNTKNVHNVHIARCVAENNAGCPSILDNHSGSGILVGHATGVLVEFCEAMDNGWDMPREGNGPVGIWAYECDSLTIQYCYSHDNKTAPGAADGGGFDFDGGMTNSVLQYNISKDNEGAGYGLFQFAGASDWANNTVRRNVSINDGLRNTQSGFYVWVDSSYPDMPLRNTVVEENLVINNLGHAVDYLTGVSQNLVFRNNTFVLTRDTGDFLTGDDSRLVPLYQGNTFSSVSGSVVPQDSGARYASIDITLPAVISVGRVRDVVSELFAQIPVKVTVDADDILSDVSHHPVGINVNFLMDGGRFENPDVPLPGALRNMGVRYLRYPGGEKSDLNLFSVPPYEKSQPTPARTAGLEDYPGMFRDGKFVYPPLDFDSFMDVCRETGAEPVIVVPADYYLIDVKPGERVSSRDELLCHAAEWVRYANVIRKYGVRYWMIGNESWNSNNVNSTPDIYARDVVDFSRAMKAVDPSIIVIPNGDSDSFFKKVITAGGDDIDRVCVSNYGVYDFKEGYRTYQDNTFCLTWPARTALDAMNKYSSDSQKKRMRLIVAEFGTIDWAGLWHGTNDMGHAIVNFDMAGQLMQLPQVEFSCFWNTRWIDNGRRPAVDHDALDADGSITPTGFALKLWNDYLADKMVAAGSSTQTVVPYATYSPADGRLFVYLINKGDRMLSADVAVYAPGGAEPVAAYEYFGTDDRDTAPVWQQKHDADDFFNLKKYSITIVEYRRPG